jgi:hypothetical protein
MECGGCPFWKGNEGMHHTDRTIELALHISGIGLIVALITVPRDPNKQPIVTVNNGTARDVRRVETFLGWPSPMLDIAGRHDPPVQLVDVDGD